MILHPMGLEKAQLSLIVVEGPQFIVDKKRALFVDQMLHITDDLSVSSCCITLHLHKKKGIHFQGRS